MSAAYVIIASIECEVCHQFEAYSLVELYNSGRQGRPIVCAACEAVAAGESLAFQSLARSVGLQGRRDAPTVSLVRKLELS